MTRINWKDSSIEDAAEVIYKINPNNHTSVESVKSYIISMTVRYVNQQIANDDLVIFNGTGGWYVTLGPNSYEGYDYWAEVTLMPYVVKRYLDDLKAKVDILLVPHKQY